MGNVTANAKPALRPGEAAGVKVRGLRASSTTVTHAPCARARRRPAFAVVHATWASFRPVLAVAGGGAGGPLSTTHPATTNDFFRRLYEWLRRMVFKHATGISATLGVDEILVRRRWEPTRIFVVRYGVPNGVFSAVATWRSQASSRDEVRREFDRRRRAGHRPCRGFRWQKNHVGCSGAAPGPAAAGGAVDRDDGYLRPQIEQIRRDNLARAWSGGAAAMCRGADDGRAGAPSAEGAPVTLIEGRWRGCRLWRRPFLRTKQWRRFMRSARRTMRPGWQSDAGAADQCGAAGAAGAARGCTRWAGRADAGA